MDSNITKLTPITQGTIKVVKEGHSPYIGDNGNWFIYDDTQKKSVDTGIKAQGPEGTPGAKGENGITGQLFYWVLPDGNEGAQLSDMYQIFHEVYQNGDSPPLSPYLFLICMEDGVYSWDSEFNRECKVLDVLIMVIADSVQYTTVEYGFSLKGDKGVKGDRGEKGEQGEDYVLTNEDLKKISTLVAVPTKTSELQNDSGYITADDAPHEVYIGSEEPQGNEVIWVDDSTTAENINATKAYVDEVVNLTNTRIVTDTENTIIPAFELAYNTEYRFMLELESIEFELPVNPTDDYISSIVFKSGATATTLTYLDLIKWSGNDLINDKFVPVANKRYTVMLWYDGIWNGLARGVVV